MPAIQFAVPLPASVPANLGIYALSKPASDPKALTDLLGRFVPMRGFYGFQPTADGDWSGFANDDTRLEVNARSGALRYATRRNAELPEQPFTIDDASLASIARTFLGKARLVEPTLDRLAGQEFLRLRVQSAGKDGKPDEPRVLAGAVIFGRELEGVSVVGPGGFVRVNIAADESVIGAHAVWRRIGGLVGSSKVRQPDYAQAQLSRAVEGLDTAGPVTVRRADFCYFERGENDAQGWLEPAYAFIFDYQTRQNRFTAKSTLVVPAIENSRQDWNPPKRFASRSDE